MSSLSIEDIATPWQRLALETGRTIEPELARALSENDPLVLVGDEADELGPPILEALADEAGRSVRRLDLEGWEPDAPGIAFRRFHRARLGEDDDGGGDAEDDPSPMSLEQAASFALGGPPQSDDDGLGAHLDQLADERAIVLVPDADSAPEALLQVLRRRDDLAVVELRTRPVPSRGFYADATVLDLPSPEPGALEAALDAMRQAIAAEDPGGELGLLDALELLAQARGPAPLELVFALLQGQDGPPDAERIEEAIDLVDDRLVDELGLLVDLQFLHPGFAFGLYDFAHPALRRAFRGAEGESAARRPKIVRGLVRRLGLRQRGPAALVGRLVGDSVLGRDRPGERLGEGMDLGSRTRRRLAFWIGEGAVTDFERAIEDGAVDTGELWQLAIQPGWNPDLRHQALESWRRHDEQASTARLGDYHRVLAEVLRLRGQLSEALNAATRALEIAGANHGSRSLPFLSAQHQCAVLLADLGQKDLALDQMEQVVELGLEILPADDAKRPMLVGDLGRAHLERGELRKARDQWQRAVELSTEIHGADHPAVARRRNNLAGLLMEVGELEEALGQVEKALPVFHQALGDAAPETLMARQNLAAITAQLGDLPGAREQMRELLELERRVHGGGPEMLSALTRLASLEAPDDPATARALYEEALAIAQPLFGEDHPAIDGLRSALAGLR